MTIEEFNNKYSVNTQVTAVQTVTLFAKTSEEEAGIHYGPVDEIIDNIDYAVFDRTTNEEVFRYEGDNEEQFLIELYNAFDIIH